MICRLGVLVVVVAYTSVTSALPPCICTREMKPVCGSDGETYNNMCLLRCRQQSNPSLELQSHGSCRSVRESGNEETCLCTLEYDPVCGSDGRTYPNRCALNCDPENRGNVQMVHEGECRAKRQVEGEGICICPYNYLPVCGTDGKTYGNECSLKCEDNVKVAYKGACRAKRESKREVAAKRACFCPYNYAPVCGSDGKTYGNECSLQCEDNVEVAYRGACRDKREVENEGPACFCTFENDPVCGSNGQTYDNMCALECEGETVQLAYKGECRVKRESVNIADLPPCICTRESQPVCGTDGKTYSNPCLLNCVREQREDLHILHPGPCTMRCSGNDLTVQSRRPCDNSDWPKPNYQLFDS